MDESLNSKPQRRTYSPQFKAELVAQCLEGHTSLTALAVDHGMNPNVLHRWVTEHARYGKHSLQSVQSTPDDQTIDITPANWVALKPAQAVQAPKANNAKAAARPSRSTGSDTIVELELSARGLTMKVRWSTHDYQAFARWARELLA
ncbi:MAG: hypothetical protein CML16_11155 [Pusillimonas sp.]|nr:hypothetical protein [Pusillimonas sp.]MBC40671.1 hypothetical protein [Pusillimonas sp.]HCP77738.1 hypothetical protein [Pusillimonas sp.]|tara:strand:+ start:20894 stop:21334 length:441 start_codon:yes stop_codon:yes gene_type:complete